MEQTSGGASSDEPGAAANKYFVLAILFTIFTVFRGGASPPEYPVSSDWLAYTRLSQHLNSCATSILTCRLVRQKLCRCVTWCHSVFCHKVTELKQDCFFVSFYFLLPFTFPRVLIKHWRNGKKTKKSTICLLTKLHIWLEKFQNSWRRGRGTKLNVIDCPHTREFEWTDRELSCFRWIVPTGRSECQGTGGINEVIPQTLKPYYCTLALH